MAGHRDRKSTILAFCNDRLWKHNRHHSRCSGTGLIGPFDHSGTQYRGICICLCHYVGVDGMIMMGDMLWALREATKEALANDDASDTVAQSLALFSEFDHLIWSDPERRMIAKKDGWDTSWSDL
jgi:hypothetical protein